MRLTSVDSREVATIIDKQDDNVFCFLCGQGLLAPPLTTRVRFVHLQLKLYRSDQMFDNVPVEESI